MTSADRSDDQLFILLNEIKQKQQLK